MSRSNRSISATRRGLARPRAPGTGRRATRGRCPGRPSGPRPRAGRGAPSASRSNPFCGSIRPIIPSTTPSSSGSKPDALEQVAPARRLAGEVAARVGRRERRVGRRVPDVGVDAVEDPERTGRRGRAAPPSRPIPNAGVSASRGEPGRDRVDELGALDRGQQQVDAVGVRRRPAARPARRPELGELRPRRPAVVGEVVERQHDRRAGEERVAAAIRPGALEERRARVPVVDVEDVERRPVAPQRRERRPAEDGEPPRVVGVVVERRRGRTPRARPRGAAGSRRPRRPRSRRRSSARRRAGPGIDRAAARRPRRRAPARTGSAAGTRRPAPRAPSPPRAAGPAPAPARRPRRRARPSSPTARTRPRAARHASSSPRSYAPERRTPVA